MAIEVKRRGMNTKQAVTFLALIAISTVFHVFDSVTPVQNVLFTVAGLCCEDVADKLESRLGKLNGVLHVKSDIDDGTIRVSVSQLNSISPRELWKSIEDSQVVPVRLTVDGATYEERPTF